MLSEYPAQRRLVINQVTFSLYYSTDFMLVNRPMVRFVTISKNSKKYFSYVVENVLIEATIDNQTTNISTK